MHHLLQSTTAFASITMFAIAATAYAAPSTNDPTPTPPAAVSRQAGSLHHLLPEAIQHKGSINVASDITYPPFETYAKGNQKVVGIDADLASAMGKLLGVKLNFVNVSFNSIIPSLSSGRFDMAMSAMNDSKAREEKVDFVDYFKAGSVILTTSAGKDKYKTLPDLCGANVGAEAGSEQVRESVQQKKECAKNGHATLTSRVYHNENEVALALHSHRIDAALVVNSTAAYTAQHSHGTLVVSSKPFDSFLFGVVLPKDKPELEHAVQVTLQHLVDDGTYRKILRKYGLVNGEVSTITINAG